MKQCLIKNLNRSAICCVIQMNINICALASAAVVQLNFRAGSTFPSQFVLYLALWTGLAGATRLTRSDFMLQKG